MPEPVQWSPEGAPRSPRFDDIYHSASGALAQARHVFLAGCALPQDWANQPQWRVLETGFGLGLNFLATWHAWRTDPCRPALLHFVSIEAYPVAPADLLRALQGQPERAELIALAEALAAQWHGLLPGLHRLVFEGGRVLLTLCVGDVQSMLRAQRFEADSLYLDGFSPQCNPQMWSAQTLRALARFARRGARVATWSVACGVRDALMTYGFRLEKAPGLPPKRECLRGVFDPPWTPRRRAPRPVAAAPGHCAVVGAGLAGAAVAASLARRGWRVTVLEAAAQPAGGASALPVGVLAPHVSADDALLSRLTRAGIRASWQQLAMLLAAGRDWRGNGVLERRAPSALGLPAHWAQGPLSESQRANGACLSAAGLPPDVPALWHARAGWVRPDRLIAAWLAQPGIALRCGRAVEHIVRAEMEGTHGAHAQDRNPGAEKGVETSVLWELFDARGERLAQADRVVIAAGIASRRFAPALALTPVRGQVAWGHAGAGALPDFPVNGNGYLIAGVPDGGDGHRAGDEEGGRAGLGVRTGVHTHAQTLWLAGASHQRGIDDTCIDRAELRRRRVHLAELLPEAAAALGPQFEAGQVNAWAGVRCTCIDRRPVVGPVTPDDDAPWIVSALGSRGLSFAALCAELLAARWHAEPLPLAQSLADALDTHRLWRRKPASR
ncbi:MAG: tRNA (5-methylaminomethyl-2-thiouridine)(34)-methyltransferase MnmD [Burkholderiaceae bacterium]|jgi:tRNA 5-methylaminomethyl-2-thiouridine biosynthesis bifunctional protein|nr:tRNA (5-methylaminomethyl-2-thiouridine)(34)-methyltransferase MnmD [Burkholderiaceae bacterium]